MTSRRSQSQCERERRLDGDGVIHQSNGSPGDLSYLRFEFDIRKLAVEDVRGAEGLEQVGVVWGAGGDDGRESGKAGELYGWKSLFKIRLVSFVRA